MKKNLSVQVLTIALFVCCFCLELVQSVQFTPETESESFRNLILANSHLLLGSSKAVYRLDDSLLKQEKRTLKTPNRMLVTDYVGSFQDSVLICSNSSCFLSQITDFNNVSWQVSNPFFRTSTTDNVVGVFAPRANGTSDLTFGETNYISVGVLTLGRFLAKGSLVNARVSSSVYSFLVYARKEEALSFTDTFVYLNEFPLRYANDSGYVYFVTRPTQNEMRIVRFCEDDGGDHNQFISHFEAVIRCGNSGNLAHDLTSAMFINITNAFNGRPTILVTQTRIVSMNSMQLEVCSFDIGTINFIMSQKFNDCVDGVNQATSGFERDGPLGTCNAVNPDARSQVGECSLPGTARPGLEVDDPHVQQPILTLPLNSVTTSITHTTLDGTLFMFAATANRTLLQFHIPNPSVANLVRTIDLPITLVENVTKMVTSDNGEYIFVMTPSKLFRHSVDMCNDFTSCTECTTSVDPICGWCPLSGMCTRQSNCVLPLPDPIWLNNSITCPLITVIDPAIVYKPQLSNVITFNLTTTNIETSSLSSFDYNCQYYFRNTNSQPVTTSATRSGAMFTCNSPPSDLVPQPSSGQDTVDTMISLALVDSGVTIASLDLFIPFTDCAVRDNCTRCIGASRCEWCPFSFKCIQPGTTCSDTSPPEQAVANGGVCPQILPSSATGEYLIHANHNYQEFPLRINSSDLRQFETDFNNERFKCELCSQDDVECNSPLFSTPASLSEDGFEVLCERTMYESVDNTPALSARLRLVWNGQRIIDNPQNASVILYSCSLMGTNCGQCLAQESRFECSYCVRSNPSSSQGNCQLQTTCSVGNGYLSFIDPQDIEHCPDALITNFEPKSGPTRGGTTVTIYGTNLGARRDDVASVMIDGVNCNVTGYTPGIAITCETGTKQASIIADRVSIDFRHLPDNVFSQEFFYFVAPALDNNSPASPNSGPQSGGTSITLMGTNIGSGSRHRVLVGGKECEVTDVQQDRIVCTTSRSDTISSNNELLQLFVDNWKQELAGFSYVDDPTFSSISPNSIILSGGMNYTITGTNLNSVQEPRLLIYYEVVSSGSRRRRRQINLSQEGSIQSEPCLVNRMTGTTMYCTAPRLNNDEFNQTNRPLRIGLLMDGVSSLLELENTSLTLYEDPTFDMFEEELIFPSGNLIFIFIQGSGFIFEQDQVTVQIDPCNSADSTVCQCSVEEVFQSNNTIRCTIDIIKQRELPASQPLMISVAIGNLVKTIGAIRLITEHDNLVVNVLTPVIVGVIILSAVLSLVTGLLVGYARARSIKLSSTNNGFDMNEFSFKNLNDTEDCTHEALKHLPQDLLIPGDQLQLFKKVIGQGEFGIVYKAKLVSNVIKGSLPPIVAVKTMKGLFNQSDIQCMISEITKMKDFDHPNVMSLIGVCLDAGPGVSLVMPFMANGCLLNYLKKERDNLYLKDDTELDEILSVRKLLLKMCHQIAKGMEYLALQKFVHRDLAARNCMLDYHGNIRVGDFGLTESTYIQGYFRQDKNDSVKLPFKWMAPESLRDGLFNEKSDVWSYGVTCWEIFSAGRVPYPALDVRYILTELEYGTRLEKPNNAACSPEVFSVMIKSWALCAEDRPSFKVIASNLERQLQLMAGYLELGMQLVSHNSEVSGDESFVEDISTT